MSYKIIDFLYNLQNGLSEEFGNITSVSLDTDYDKWEVIVQEDEVFLIVRTESETTHNLTFPFLVKEEDFVDPDLLKFMIVHMKAQLENYKPEETKGECQHEHITT